MGSTMTVSIDTRPSRLRPSASAHTTNAASLLSTIVLTLAACAALLGIAQQLPTAQAISANPQPFTEVQADGSEITLHVRGSERGYWLHDERGFIVVQRQQNGAPTPSGSDDTRELQDGSDSQRIDSRSAANTPTAADPMYYYTMVGSDGALQATDYAVGRVDPSEISGLAHKSDASSQDALVSSFVAGPIRRTRTRQVLEGAAEGAGVHISDSLSIVGAAVAGASASQRPMPPTTGVITNLVVMVRWSNDALRVDLPTVDQLQALFNNVGPAPGVAPAGSVRDSVLANSNGQLTINSVFTGWLNVSARSEVAAQENSGLACCNLQSALQEALKLADNAMDFSAFDSNNDGAVDLVTFVHSGYAAELGGTDVTGRTISKRIWSHQSSFLTPYTSTKTGKSVNAYTIGSAFWGVNSSELAHVGVFAHELMHNFGLPDLYDTDSEHLGVGVGLGNWCLMASSWGWDSTQNYPPLMSAWARAKMGWVNPTVISTPGAYLAPVGSTVYKVTQGFPEGEFLLIENRVPSGFDSQIPQGGLAVYHVDEKTDTWDTQGAPPGFNGWPWNHYRVALVQADGLFQLETTNVHGDAGDLYRAGGSVLGPNTVPNTNTYQFGVVRATGLTLAATSAPGAIMTFQVSWPTTTFLGINDLPSPSATDSPTVSESPWSLVPQLPPMTTSTGAVAAPTPPPVTPTTTTSSTPTTTTTTSSKAPSASAAPAVPTTTNKATTGSGAARQPSVLRVGSVAVSSAAAGSTGAKKQVRGRATVSVLAYTSATATTRGTPAAGVRISGRFERVTPAGVVVYQEAVVGTTTSKGTLVFSTVGAWAVNSSTSASLRFCVVSMTKKDSVQDVQSSRCFPRAA